MTVEVQDAVPIYDEAHAQTRQRLGARPPTQAEMSPAGYAVLGALRTALVAAMLGRLQQVSDKTFRAG